jgi:menaquinone-9 beta-reductase
MSTTSSYDAIIVGARAGGAATAMLLARRGLRVLVVDRSRYGSDTLSTHALMRTAVLQLDRWGVLDAVRASGAPPIREVAFHYPDETVSVRIRPSDGVDALYAPRRSRLDRILVDAAREAGAEVRFGVIVDELQKDDSGRVIGIVGRDELGDSFSPRGGIVIGADGIRSVVALAAEAPVTRRASVDGAVVYGYFRGVEAVGYEWAYGPRVAAGLIPTNDGEVCVFVGGPPSRFRKEVHPDLHRGFHRILEEACPEIAVRLRSAEQSGRFRGFSGVKGYYRRPWGSGWALVGDAGLFRDPITTHGISDAFRDAELLARAIVGTSSFEEYEHTRDEVTRDLFDVTERIASYDWTAEEIRDNLRLVNLAMRPGLDMLLGIDEPAHRVA